MFFFLLNTSALGGDDTKVESLQTTKNDILDISYKLKAIEIFLDDKEKHQAFCSSENWLQPELSVYVDKQSSQLSFRCLSLIIPSTPVQETEEVK